ncbi:recombinase RecA [cf. Phormidesmis sp. LEGE 11477]|uniref:recombinase RecA n=1 Tax=cf. Phormidesmis sp. LEGE 11477 TaxID=1828680 RepID=UPI00187F85BB|nr:recombinase RecA [cf. Phormidesmis sp. LEGE 11477]MBE9060084.1 recombinase RecA [cf. Phormidesmis sp. LEGE 11477]
MAYLLNGRATPATADIAERKRVLGSVVAQIERSWGQGSIMRLGQTCNLQVERISTGALTLDIALGGGLPKGRVIEIFGPESAGKTTLALHAIASIQSQGGTAAFIDAEHALDPSYAAAIGVDTSTLLVAQPDSGEMALEITDRLVRSSAVDIVAIDSVAALVPRAEIEGEMGDRSVGLQARLMSQALRKITGSIGKSGCTVIFLNQLRQKIGVLYGSPEVTTGGNALKFYASVRLDIRRVQALRKGNDNFGMRVRVNAVKNKVAPPCRVAEFDILFGNGISKAGCIFDLAQQAGVIDRQGTWYCYQGETLAQGRDNTVHYLMQHYALAQSIESAVRDRIVLT